MRLRPAISAAGVLARNLFLGGNLVALSRIGDPGRLVSYINESLFLFGTMTGSRGLEQRNVFDVFDCRDAQGVLLGNLRSSEVWFREIASYATDIVSLCLLCQIVRPRTVFEIGTLRGYTTLHLALNTPEDSRIYSLDMPSSGDIKAALQVTVVDEEHIAAHRRVDRYCFEGTDVESKIVLLHGDSATFNFSPYHGTVDLFFIDGAHSFDYVRSDTLNAMKCTHPGGVIVWHDFGRWGVNGVSRWLRQFARTERVYSVPGGSLAFMIVR